MRRVRLDPGPYDLSDFPTGYGATDVRLNIVDDTGKAETLRFNMFFDQNQLAAGRSEFSLYAGTKAPRLIVDIRSTDDSPISGFYRMCISKHFTFGGKAHAQTTPT